MHLHMTSKQFNLLYAILGRDLDKEDTQFRPSLKGDERIALSLHVLADSLHFGHGDKAGTAASPLCTTAFTSF